VILKQATVEKHVMQNAQLSELLHMANEKPIMVRDENSFLHNSTPEVENDPKFVGKPTEINLRTREGMPKHIQHDELAAFVEETKLNANTKNVVN
jgi:hypothetical protein